MRKSIAALLASEVLMLSGCAVASADEEYKAGDIVVTEVTLSD